MLRRDARQSQMPTAICETVSRLNLLRPNLLITQKPPFDNLGFAPGDRNVDRSQGVDRHSRRGAGRDQHRDAAGASEGVWAMPQEMMQKLARL